MSIPQGRIRKPPKRKPPENGSKLLDEVRDFITKYVIYPTDHESVAVTLWAAMTYCYESFSQVPYLHIKSAVPECGKSRNFEVLRRIARNPMTGANISPAVMYYVIEQEKPTVLLDEIDKIPRGSQRAEETFGLLNAGYERSIGFVWRMAKEGQSHKPRRFTVYGPKALAGIGKGLEDATITRCIPIEMQRQTRDRRAEDLDDEIADLESEPLKVRLETWVTQSLSKIQGNGRDAPEKLTDRQRQIWRPLFAIADAAGGDWPKMAREAAVTLHGRSKNGTEDVSLLLLEHIRMAFDEHGTTKISSEDLVEFLFDLQEGPWASMWDRYIRTDRSGMVPTKDYRAVYSKLSEMLRPFGIKPEKINSTTRGYRREQFIDHWNRLLPTEVGMVGTPELSQVKGFRPRIKGSERSELEVPEVGTVGTRSEPSDLRKFRPSGGSDHLTARRRRPPKKSA